MGYIALWVEEKEVAGLTSFSHLCAVSVTHLLAAFYHADGFQITVDNKNVKTPAGNCLVVPSKQLAMAIAVEWNAQTGIMKPESMHLVRRPLCGTRNMSKGCIYMYLLSTNS